MNEEERRAALHRLYNPVIADPCVSHDYGVLMSDLPPRRTLRERLRALAWWRRLRASERSEASDSQP